MCFSVRLIVPLTDISNVPNANSEQCKLMHPGTHKLLKLELEQQEESASDTQMDTTDIAINPISSDFQRVGEFAQMG